MLSARVGVRPSRSNPHPVRNEDRRFGWSEVTPHSRSDGCEFSRALSGAFHPTDRRCPPRFGEFMNTRTIAIAALIIAVILVIVLFIV